VSTFEGVPCVACHHNSDHWRHKGGLAFSPASKALAHAYVPDERSVEWAAVRLREALDAMLESAAELDDARMHYVVLQVDRVVLSEARVAVELAAAAGIGAVTTSERVPVSSCRHGQRDGTRLPV
jgi:hypothetical protein